MRSALFLAIGFALLAMMLRGSLKRGMAVGLLGAAVLVDLYGTDKRYVSHSSFCTPEVQATDAFAPDAIDNLISILAGLESE